MTTYTISSIEANLIDKTVTPLENIQNAMQILNMQYEVLTNPKATKSDIETHGALFIVFAECLGNDMKYYLNSKSI